MDYILLYRDGELALKAYTEKEFIELLKKKPDVNLLAAAITPLHALGVDAAILQLTEKGIIPKGYIMCVAHSLTGNLIDENNFQMRFQDGIEVIRILPDTEKKTIKEKILNKYQEYVYYLNLNRKTQEMQCLYWITPMEPSYELIPKVAKVLPERFAHMIITDEGLGGYLDSKATWLSTILLECGMKQMIRSIWNMYFRNIFYKRRLINRKQLEYNRLLVGKKNHWKPNGNVVEAYRRIMRMEKSQSDYSNYSNAFLINTDPLYESGRLSKEVDIKIYKEICNKLEKLQIPVILKTHPREKKVERYKQLNCEFETKSGAAQETILAHLEKNPYCVIGIASTTLVNAKVLFDIDAISINHLIDKKYLAQQDFYKRFNKAFSNTIYIPRTKAELYDTIDEIIKKHVK